MLRKILIPTHKQCTLTLPDEFLNKKIEILIVPFEIDSEDINSVQPEDTTRFWSSFGSWQDNRNAEDIIRDIYESRTSTERTLQL